MATLDAYKEGLESYSRKRDDGKLADAKRSSRGQSREEVLQDLRRMYNIANGEDYIYTCVKGRETGVDGVL